MITIKSFLAGTGCIMCGMLLATVAIEYDKSKFEDRAVKLTPTVIVSGFQNNELRFRASMTNDTILFVGTNGLQLKVDIIYGNHGTGIERLDKR